MKCFIMVVVGCLGMVWLSGCASAPVAPDATTIQGTWKGTEVHHGQATTSWLTLDGNELDFRGANANEWYRGTFTLNETAQPKQFIATIAQSGAPQYVGKTCNAIYELTIGSEDHGTLILTGNEPGDPRMPSGFSDRRARQIVFTKD